MAAKRARNGSGSARKLRTGWQLRVTLPDGSRTSYFGATLAEAQARASEDRTPRTRGGATLAEWLGVWLDAKRQRLKPQTWRLYESHVVTHLTPILGNVRLDVLAPSDLDRLHGHLARTVTGTTAHHVHMTLSAALTDAERRGLPVVNVTRLVAAPRRNDTAVQTLSPSAVGMLISGVRGDPFEAAYVLAVTVGMRQGELLGLRWADVDLPRRSLVVTYSAGPGPDGTPALGKPKTASSRRAIALPAIARDALARTPQRGALVWPGEGGTPLTGRVFREAWYATRRRLGLPPVTFHALRHTAATQALGAGVPADLVGRMLGHSSVATTLRIYAHATPARLETAADTIDALYRTTQTGPVPNACPIERPTVAPRVPRRRGFEYESVRLRSPRTPRP